MREEERKEERGTSDAAHVAASHSRACTEQQSLRDQDMYSAGRPSAVPGPRRGRRTGGCPSHCPAPWQPPSSPPPTGRKTERVKHLTVTPAISGHQVSQVGGSGQQEALHGSSQEVLVRAQTRHQDRSAGSE